MFLLASDLVLNTLEKDQKTLNKLFSHKQIIQFDKLSAHVAKLTPWACASQLSMFYYKQELHLQ